MIRLDIVGLPAPKGSSRAMMRGGHAVNVPSGSNANRDKMRSWNRCIVDACLDYTGAPLTGALGLAVVFCMPRRKGDLTADGRVKADAPLFSTVKPDADKLLRALLDSLTASGRIWTDDAQVAAPIAARIYAPPGSWTGAMLHVARIRCPADVAHLGSWLGAALVQADLATNNRRAPSRNARIARASAAPALTLDPTQEAR